MDRRGFLGLLGLGAVGLTLDPERLLWVPGEKTIFVPPVTGWSSRHQIGEIVAEAWERAVGSMPEDLCLNRWLFDALTRGDMHAGDGPLVVPVEYA